MGKRWKRHEREVAAAQGVRRNPNTGEHRADIDTPAFAEEHKLRKSLPKWLIGAMAQAEAAAEDGQTPVVILSTASQGRKTKRYTVMRFDDWLGWHGPTEQARKDVLIAYNTVQAVVDGKHEPGQLGFATGVLMSALAALEEAKP